MNSNQINDFLINEEDIKFEQAEEGKVAHQLRVSRINKNPLIINKGKVRKDNTKKIADQIEVSQISNLIIMDSEIHSFDKLQQNLENFISNNEKAVHNLNEWNQNDKSNEMNLIPSLKMLMQS